MENAIIRIHAMQRRITTVECVARISVVRTTCYIN